MIPAYADVSFFVEACAKADFHVVWNETAAWTHVRTVGKFAGIFLVPENHIGKAKNLVVKEIDCTDVGTDIEHEHEGTLNTEICYDCRKRETGERSTDSANIEIL